MRPKLQYACSAWDPHYQKDKAALERVQRKVACFVTENYNRTASMTAMLQDLKWDTLETVRREGEHEEGMILNLLYQKDIKDIFKFSFFPRTITEWNILPKETVISLSLSTFKSKL